MTKGYQDQYLDVITDSIFQGVNRFCNSKINIYRKAHTVYSLPNGVIKDHNAIVDEKFFFSRPVENMEVTYDLRNKTWETQQPVWMTVMQFSFKLSFPKEQYKIIAINWSKSQIFDGDHKARQQMKFIAKCYRVE